MGGGGCAGSIHNDPNNGCCRRWCHSPKPCALPPQGGERRRAPSAAAGLPASRRHARGFSVPLCRPHPATVGHAGQRSPSPATRARRGALARLNATHRRRSLWVCVQRSGHSGLGLVRHNGQGPRKKKGQRTKDAGHSGEELALLGAEGRACTYPRHPRASIRGGLALLPITHWLPIMNIARPSQKHQWLVWDQDEMSIEWNPLYCRMYESEPAESCKHRWHH